MNGDSIVMKHVGDGSVRTVEQMLSELEMLMGYYERRPGLGVWAIELKNSGELVGAGGLTFNKDRENIELGYRFLTDHWNKGYATEVAKALLRYAFQKLKLTKVIASSHIENIGSRKVLEKVGMKQIGTGMEFNCMQAYYEITWEDYSSTSDENH